jgi:predicted MFS family arabinose efflux permease
VRSDSLLRHRDFRLLWGGDTISQFGSFTGEAVLPLLAVTMLAASPMEMGLLHGASSLAFLLIGLPAGAWVDRTLRRPLMIRSVLLRAALLLSLPVAAWAGLLTMTQMILVAFATGVCTVFFDISYQSYLTSLVSRDQLAEGNAKLQASQQVAFVAGPAAGGGITQLASAANAVLLIGFSYLAAASLLVRVRTRERSPVRVPSSRLRDEIKEGLRFVLHNRSIRALAFSGATAMFFLTMTNVVLVLFLASTLALPSTWVGILLAVEGVGGVLAAATANVWIRVFGPVRVIWVSLAASLPFGLLLALAEPGSATMLAAVALLIPSYGVTIHNIAQITYRQASCPDELQGRMTASMRFILWGTRPLGAIAGGALGEWIGLRNTLWVAAVGVLAAIPWLVLSPLRSGKRIITAEMDSSV